MSSNAYQLTQPEMSHLKAWITASKGEGSKRAAVLKDLVGKTEPQVDAYLATAREVVKSCTKDGSDQQKALLGNLSRIVSGHRKAQGWAGKRAKGAGRPSKPEVKVDETTETPLAACDRGLVLIRDNIGKVGKSERETFIKRLIAVLPKN